MKLKFLVEEDFLNYKKPSMFIGFPNCTWKCERECGKEMCHNKSLAHSPSIDIKYEDIVKRYMENPICQAIVFGGLEPFDSWEDVVNLIQEFRKYTEDMIIIYSGYYKSELNREIEYLRQNYNNIIIKYGRFKPDMPYIFDETLGVKLASDNQYAERIC